jgi:hypothetical protein
VGGIELTSGFLTGGIFSADGVHASNIGYAIVARLIVQQLNDTAGTDFELPDLAHTLFEPDVPVITATGVIDPSAGPFGYSIAMWRDLVGAIAPGDFETVFPGSAKRAKKLDRP